MMKIHLHIARADAIRGRRALHGDHTIEVDAQWLEDRTEAELEYLATCGAWPNQACGRDQVGSAVQSPPLLDATPDALAAWLRTRLAAIDAHVAETGRQENERQKQEQERQQERAARAASWPARVEEWFRKYPTPADLLEAAEPWDMVGCKPHTSPDYWARVDDLHPELATRINAHIAQAQQIRREAQAAAREAKKMIEHAEHIAWIREHGSPHLRTLVDMGYSHDATYRRERVAYELGDGWIAADRICRDTEDIGDPSPSVLGRLIDARCRWPDVQLRWCHCAHDDGHDGPHIGCAVLSMRVMGRTYLLPLIEPQPDSDPVV